MAGADGAVTREAVTRDQIERKLTQIRDEVEKGAEAARPSIVRTGVAVAIVVVLVAYLFGRRRGRRRSTVVEIRRV